MSDLILSNIGRTVKIKIDTINLQYLGPKNLVRFSKINKVVNGCIYVDTVFKDDVQYTEEDYIDLKDLLNEFEYNADSVLSSIENYRINNKEIEMDKNELINKALMVSDNFALLSKVGSANDIQILAVNMAKTEYKALISFNNFNVLSSNMSDAMLKRAVEAVKRNKTLIIDALKEMKVNA